MLNIPTGAQGKSSQKEENSLRPLISGECEAHSAKEPTYWPTDPDKVPDLLDFFIVKGILGCNIFMENITDLSSDHTSVLMNLSASNPLPPREVQHSLEVSRCG